MIISSVGDVNRYFIDGENALIIDPDNQELLVNAINRLIQDPVLGKKLSTNALMLLEKDLNYLYNSSLLKIFFEKSNI
jgi:glycosyltransferase involved in cell wall biosynthesis